MKKNKFSATKQRIKYPVKKASGKGPANRPSVTINKPGYPSISEGLDRSSLTVSAPTAKSTTRRSGIPRLNYRNNGDCAIRHREFVSDINGSVGFAVTAIALNPGLNGSFPWLSRIAANFESYRFRKLCISFSTESATTATGTVILAVDYDPADSAPTSKTQVLSYRGTVRSSPWSPSCHDSLPEDLNKRKSYYTRAGTVNADLALYDVGNLYVCTQGMAGATLVGEIWIDYEVELMTPNTLSAGSGNAIWGKFVMPTGATMAPFVQTGNLNAVHVQTPFGGGITSFFTFTTAWQGVASLSITGTTIVLGAAQIGGTATLGTVQLQNNGAGTAGAGYVEVNAQPGQTLTVNWTFATNTGAIADFTQGLGAFN